MQSPKPHPDDKACDNNCDPADRAGPVREAGGSTGAGNPAPASRTGGATGGVDVNPTPATATVNDLDPQHDPGVPKAPGKAPDPNFAAGDHGPIKGAKHPEEPAQPSKHHDTGTAGERRTSDQR